MRKNTLVYISGPISPANGKIVEENVADALKVFLEVIRLRIPAFCPHLQAIYPSAHAYDYQMWLDYDCAVIDRCTHMLMLEGWEQSKGARVELEYANDIGLPIFYTIDQLAEALIKKE